MKISKKLIALILALLIAVSVIAVAVVNVNAAAGDKVYCRASFVPNCYMWKSNTDENNHAWPGVAMTKVAGETDVYEYTVPADKFDMIIFNGNGQTGNMQFPGGNKLYDYATQKWSDYSVDPVPVISVSKEGGSFKDSVTVTITVTDADSAYYTVDNGAHVAINGTATVTIGANSPEGASIKLDISATNSYGTTTKSCTYKKRSTVGPATDGSTADPVGGNYATNPNNGYGKRKTITVDGDKSDWESSMLIAQGVANDDPRVYAHWSMHEIAFDDYAMYAAWDDDNLYLMYEMANVQDVVAPGEDYPMTQGNLWINNIPVFLYIYSGEGNLTHGETANGTLWGSGNTFDANADHIVAFSTNNTNGPFIYTADDEGILDPDDPDLTIARADTGINIEWGNGKTLSGKLMGIPKAGTDNGRVPGDTVSATLTDFYTKGHKASMDMFYEMSIPLANLGISSADIESNGIGVLKLSTFGTSGMDCLPYDPSMSDNAAKPYSADASTSMEKEDEDHLTVPFARVGKAFTPGAALPTEPPVPTEAPTDPPVPTEPPTDPPVPTEPPVVVNYGDADDDGDVTILDVTYIQRYEAGIYLATPLNVKNADVDSDDEVSIIDATLVQRWLVGIIDKFPAES